MNRTLRLTQAGETLFRAADDAIARIDAATEVLAGAERRLAVTTTPAFASTWLAPRLPRFAQVHPGTDVRDVATNDRVDLAREHPDLAIHFVPPWDTPPDAERLVDYLQFPVCSPALLRSGRPPLRTPADLARHARVEFETVLYGRPWYDWERWFDVMRRPPVAPATTMRFSHYDQVIQAAIEGSGVAIGKWPHLATHLRSGRLRPPFGRDCVVVAGAFHLVFARRPHVGDAVHAFAAWLREEVRRDAAAAAPALLGLRASGDRTPVRTARPRAARPR